MESDYSNREIDRMLTTFSDKLQEVKEDLTKQGNDHASKEQDAHLEFGKILLRVEGKVDITNGKVAAITKWKEQAIGGAKVGLAFTVLILLPLAVWAITTLLNIQTSQAAQIQTAVNTALSAYNITNGN